MKISDFLSDRQWRRTELFSDCYGGRLGMGWEISTQIRFDQRTRPAWHWGAPIATSASATGRSSTSINPHLRAAYARFEQEAARDDRIALLERGIESRGEVLFLVAPRGKITAAGSTARAILRRWFDDRPDQVACPGGRVLAPPPSRRSRPFPARPQARRPAAAAAPPAGDRGGRDPDLRAPRRAAGSRPTGQALPISRREAEVLALISQGHINASIAVELDLSPNTVGRYVERLYAKLDVHNRAEATAAVRDALDW